MLSQENIDKLHMNGVYCCEPVLSWLPSYKRDNPYWCKNWTFRVSKSAKGRYYMRDTYWSTGDDSPIELTDENFDKFEFLFDLNDVRFVNSYSDWIEYPEDSIWCEALDSGGILCPKYIVKKDATKDRDKVIERITREIDSLRNSLEDKEWILNGILAGELDYNIY